MVSFTRRVDLDRLNYTLFALLPDFIFIPPVLVPPIELLKWQLELIYVLLEALAQILLYEEELTGKWILMKLTLLNLFVHVSC